MAAAVSPEHQGEPKVDKVIRRTRMSPGGSQQPQYTAQGARNTETGSQQPQSTPKQVEYAMDVPHQQGYDASDEETERPLKKRSRLDISAPEGVDPRKSERKTNSINRLT